MRARWLAAVCAAVLLVSLPAAATEGVDDAAEELEGARSDLDGARSELSSGAERLAAVRAELDVLDARLRSASGDLAAVESDLVDAEAALAEASAAQLVAAAALAEAGDRLQDELDAWDEARDQLQRRVADAYKHGGMASSRYLLSGIVRSEDMHDVARTMRTVETLIDREQRAVDDRVLATRRTAEARAEIATVRAEAKRRQQAAADHRRRVQDLVTRQETLVARIADEQAQQAALLAELQADQEATQALVEELQRRVRELQVALADAWLRDIATIPFDGPAPAWSSGLPSGGRAWAPAVEASASAAGVDGRLLAALVWTESNFTPNAVSHAGAIGMAQLMPGTAAGLGVDPWDPLQNMTGGGRYLRSQLVRFGRVDLALAAYNAGPGRVVAAGNEVPDIVETQLYVVRVLERFERIAAAG